MMVWSLTRLALHLPGAIVHFMITFHAACAALQRFYPAKTFIPGCILVAIGSVVSLVAQNTLRLHETVSANVSGTGFSLIRC